MSHLSQRWLQRSVISLAVGAALIPALGSLLFAGGCGLRDAFGPHEAVALLNVNYFADDECPECSCTVVVEVAHQSHVDDPASQSLSAGEERNWGPLEPSTDEISFKSEDCRFVDAKDQGDRYSFPLKLEADATTHICIWHQDVKELQVQVCEDGKRPGGE